MVRNASFRPTATTERHEALRRDVREFLHNELPADHEPGLGMVSGHSPVFSRKLAARGLVGMAFPVAYGGHGRSVLDRFVVIEELLAAGAPVAAHWTADRQSGPTILRFGTD
ncbi:MAG TPA: acyl-CoA dehydrogenase family protein, partial [Acidimicrobiia bacterium]|nr:acyl-CoA dehydrogenase family protein [Acidimicrobiia bacterium]